MSKYNYYNNNKNKKTKLFSWATYFKMLSIILVSFIGIFGITILVLYLTGSFEEKRIPPDGIKLVLNEDDENSTVTINNVEYYIPEISTDENGVKTFMLTIADALKSVDEGQDTTYLAKATLTELTVDVSDERVIKVKSNKCVLDEPIVFELVKNSKGYIQGGFATITIRSGDGVYGSVSQKVFIDVPVESVKNNVKVTSEADGIGIIEDGQQVPVRYMLVGDDIEVYKPIYEPTHSSNPTISSSGKMGLADKIYNYSIESLTQQAYGGYQWTRELELEYNSTTNTYSWKNTGSLFKIENKKIIANKKGVFRVACSTYSTYADQDKDSTEEVQFVNSEYSYFEIKEVSYEGLTSTLSSYIFDYSMHGVNSINDVQEYRLYLNTDRTVNRSVNLGLTPTIPSKYNVDGSKLKSALKDVFLTVDSNVRQYYSITGSSTTSQGILPIEDYGDYYYSIKLIKLQSANVVFKFNLNSGDSNGTILTKSINFAMKDYDSTIQFKNIPSSDDTSMYGKYLNLEVRNAVINNKNTQLMKLRVDKNDDYDDKKYGVDLSRLVTNTAIQPGKEPSYWLIKYYIKLTKTNSGNNLDEIQAQMVDGTISNEVVEFGNDIIGAEIEGGYFAPQAYASFEVYAILMKTDVNGEPIIDAESGTLRYRSCSMFVDVEIVLSGVTLTMYSEGGEELEGNIIKENYSYYIKIEPDIEGVTAQDDLLKNYVEKISIKAKISNDSEQNLILPVNVGPIEYFNTNQMKGYFALIRITATQDIDKGKTRLDYVHTVYFTAIYDNDSENLFGYTDDFTIKDTSVSSVTIVADGAERKTDGWYVTFNAGWSGSNIVWSYKPQNNQSAHSVNLQNDGFGKLRKYVFTVSLGNAENITIKYSYASSSIEKIEIKTLNGVNECELYISDIIEDNSIKIDIMSNENEIIKDTLYVTLTTPKIIFNTTQDAKDNYGIEVDQTHNEIKKPGQNGVYNHESYSGDKFSILSFINAKIIGQDIYVNDMLTYEFENPTQVSEYAILNKDADGKDVKGLIRFVKNPAKPIVITVTVKAFSSSIKIVFLLKNNIVIKYKDIKNFFNETAKVQNTDKRTQNRIIMSVYDNVYYPTVVYFPAGYNNSNLEPYQTVLDLSELFEVYYDNNPTGDKPKVKYSLASNDNNVLLLSETGKLSTIGSAYVSTPRVFRFQIMPDSEEGGTSQMFTFLLVPDLQIHKAPMGRTTLALTQDNLIKDKTKLNNEIVQREFTAEGLNVFLAGNYNISVENMQYTLQAKDINGAVRSLILKTTGEESFDDSRLFTILNFAGVDFSNASANSGAYLGSLTTGLGVKSISFGFVNNNVIESSSYGLSIDEFYMLNIETNKILTTVKKEIRMRLIFNQDSGKYIEVSAVLTINPYYEIVLNKEGSSDIQLEVKRANDIAKAHPYRDIIGQANLDNSIVIYVNEAIKMEDLLTITINDADATTEGVDRVKNNYFGNFSYERENTSNSAVRFDDPSTRGIKLVGSNYSGTSYAKMKVKYNGELVGYVLNVFVCSNANIWDWGSENPTLNNNLGLSINAQNIEGLGVVSPATSQDSITSTNKVKSGIALNLNNMFTLKALGVTDNVELTFKVENLEGSNLSKIGTDNVITFYQSAKNVLIKLSVTAPKISYLKTLSDKDGNPVYTDSSLTWIYYFELMSTQTIEVKYPFENNSAEFNAMYDEEVLNDASIKGVNGYVRLVPRDALNIGDENGILIAHDDNGLSIWDQLIFTVQYYDATNRAWVDTTIYSLYDAKSGKYLKTITLPGNISADYEYTRIHVTSKNSGVNAYINVKITQNKDDAPTINYPAKSTITFTSDGNQYELRDKKVISKAVNNSVADYINLTDYDTRDDINVLRIGLIGSNYVFYSVEVVGLNGNKFTGVYVTVDENGYIEIYKNSTYDGEAFIIKVYLRSDYGYFVNSANQKVSYNIYYGNKTEVQSVYGSNTVEDNYTVTITSGLSVTHLQEGYVEFNNVKYDVYTEAGSSEQYIIIKGAKFYIRENSEIYYLAYDVHRYLRYDIDDKNDDNNKIYLSDLFDIVSQDSSVVTLLDSNYDILPRNNYYTVTKDANNQLYIGYGTNNGSVTVPHDGYTLLITLKIALSDNADDYVSATTVVRIFPSNATVSNENDDTINSKENPAFVACGEDFIITKSNIHFSGLDGEWLTYYLNNEELASSLDYWKITESSIIYNPLSSPKEYVISIKNGDVIVRQIIYYVQVMPKYQLVAEHSDSAGVIGSGEDSVYYANIYSGTVYNTTISSNAVYFVLYNTKDGVNYTVSDDLSLYTLSFKLLNLNGEFVSNLIIDAENKIINLANGGIYGVLNKATKTIEFRMTAQDCLIEVIATLNADANPQENSYSKQSVLIKLIKNVDSSRVNFKSDNNLDNVETNPITLNANGVDLLQFLNKNTNEEVERLNLYNKNDLSSYYLTGSSFSRKKFIELLDATFTTFDANGETVNVLTLVEDGDYLLVRPDSRYRKSEDTVHSITFSMLGVQLATVYFVVPRSYAFTFDSSFTTMYASDVLDLSLLASSLIDHNEDVIGDNKVYYKLVSTTASATNVEQYVALDSVNQHLTIKANYQNIEQDVTLIAYCYAENESGETVVYSAKATVHVLPKNTLEITQNVLYENGANIQSYIKPKESGVDKQLSDCVSAGEDVAILYNNKKPDGTAFDTNNTLEAYKISVQGNTDNMFVINNKHNAQSNAIFYSAINAQDNLVAGLDVNLANYLGEFYYIQTLDSGVKNIRQSSVSNISYYDISFAEKLVTNAGGSPYTEYNAVFTPCENDVLSTSISAKEYTKYILVKADVNFVVGEPFTETCYGIIKLTIYPTIALNTSYTHNAQSVSVFKAIKNYNLNDYIKVDLVSGDSNTINTIRHGKIDFKVALYGEKDGEYKDVTPLNNVNEYFSLEKYVVIGGVEYTLSYNSTSGNYELIAKTGNTLIVQSYNTNYSYLTYGDVEYDVQNRLVFTDNAIGYSAIISASYSNSQIPYASTLICSYFIKVDVMDLELTVKDTMPTLRENSVLDYTLFVNANENVDGKATISFENADSPYYSVKGNKIVNVCNIYPVECLIKINFTYSRQKTFTYTVAFMLQPNITISYKTSTSGSEITTKQFAGINSGNLLNSINYTGSGDFALDGENSLLNKIEITINSNTITLVKGEKNGRKCYVSQNLLSDITVVSTSLSDVALEFGPSYQNEELEFVVMFNFVASNQIKNLVLTIKKVLSTEQFNVQNVRDSYTLYAGQEYTIENVLASSHEVDIKGSLLEVYTSDSNILGVEKIVLNQGSENEQTNIKLNPALMISSNAYTIKTYITFVFVGSVQAEDVNGVMQTYSLFEQKTIPVSIELLNESDIQAVDDTSSNTRITYPTLKSSVTKGDDVEIDISGTEITSYREMFVSDSSRQNVASENFATYFEEREDGYIYPKQTYYTMVELYLYRQYTLSSGQKIILQNKYTIYPDYPILQLGETTVENGNLYTLDTNGASLTVNGNSRIISVDYSSDYKTNYLSKYGSLTITGDVANQNFKLEHGTATNVNVPIEVKVQSTCGEVYTFVLNIKCENPDIVLNDPTIAGDIDASSGLPSGFNAYYAVSSTGTITQVADSIPTNAKYLVCQSVSDKIYTYKIYSVKHAYNLYLEDAINGGKTYKYSEWKVYNSIAFNYDITFAIDGYARTIENSAMALVDYKYTDKNGNEFGYDETSSPIKYINKHIAYAPSDAVSGTCTFTISVTYNGVSYQKTFTVTFVHGYSSENVTINGNLADANSYYMLPYNNGFVLNASTPYALVDLASYKYVNEQGTVYSYYTDADNKVKDGSGNALTTIYTNVGDSGCTTDIIGVKDGQILSTVYPTGNWLRGTDNKIYGYQYTQQTRSFSIPVKAKGSNTVIYINYNNFIISREGIRLNTATKYDSAKEYNSVVDAGKDFDYPDIDYSGENYTEYKNKYDEYDLVNSFPFEISVSFYTSGLSGQKKYYASFNMENNTNNGGAYEKNSKPDYRIKHVKQISFNNNNGYLYNEQFKVELGSDKTFKGKWLDYSLGEFDRIKDYDGKYTPCKIKEDASFYGFIEVSVNTDCTYIIPVEYTRQVGSTVKDAKYTDNKQKTGVNYSNGKTFNASDINNYFIDYIIADSNKTNKQLILSKYGVTVGEENATTYTFMHNNNHYTIYILKPTTISTEGAGSGTTLVGDKDNFVASDNKYKTKYENIKLAYNSDVFTFSHYKNANQNFETLGGASNASKSTNAELDKKVKNSITQVSDSVGTFISANLTSGATESELKISKYVIKKGLVTSYSDSDAIELLLEREDGETTVSGTGISLTFAVASHAQFNNCSGTQVVFDSLNLLTDYVIKVNGSNLHVAVITSSNTRIDYFAPSTVLTIEADSYKVITIADVGVLTRTVGEDARIVLGVYNGVTYGNLNNLTLTSLNENVATIQGNKIITGFVLQDTYVTINADYSTASSSDSKISFHFDILIQSGLEIQTVATSINVSSGENVDITSLYTIKQDGVNISIEDIAGATITYYLDNIEQESSIINANSLYAYAGSVVPLKISVVVNGDNQNTRQQLDLIIALNIEENLYQLNIKENVYSLYAGESINLSLVHLRLMDAKGYLITSNPYIKLVDYPDNSYPYTISGTTITAMNVFADQRATVKVVLCKDSASLDEEYVCYLDLYLLKSFYVQDEYVIDTAYVGEEISYQDVIKNINFYDRFNNIYPSSKLEEFTYNFGKDDKNKDITSFSYSYDTLNNVGDYNLEQTLYIYHQGHLMHSINVVVRTLKANRSLTYKDATNSNTVVYDYTSASSIDLINDLFNKYFVYNVQSKGIDNGKDIANAQINKDWFDVEIVSGNATYNAENASITNNNALGDGIVTHDTVKLSIKDRQTKQTVSIYVVIKRV